jgi:RNA polymerase sigma-54 factor
MMTSRGHQPDHQLNPKPGGDVGETSKIENYVVPDFFIFNNNGKLEITLNSKNAPIWH